MAQMVTIFAPTIDNQLFKKKKSIDIDLIVDERFSAVPVRFQCNYSSSLLITIDNYHRKKSINTNSIFGLWTSAVTVQFQCNFHWRLQFFFSLHHFFFRINWKQRLVQQETNDKRSFPTCSNVALPPPSPSPLYVIITVLFSEKYCSCLCLPLQLQRLEQWQ